MPNEIIAYLCLSQSRTRQSPSNVVATAPYQPSNWRLPSCMTNQASYIDTFWFLMSP